MLNFVCKAVKPVIDQVFPLADGAHASPGWKKKQFSRLSQSRQPHLIVAYDAINPNQ
jgi:hypothetical protein